MNLQNDQEYQTSMLTRKGCRSHFPMDSPHPVWSPGLPTSSIHHPNCFLNHQWEQIRCFSWRYLYKRWHIFEMQPKICKNWWVNWQRACGERQQTRSVISRNNISPPEKRSWYRPCQRERGEQHTTPKCTSSTKMGCWMWRGMC